MGSLSKIERVGGKQYAGAIVVALIIDLIQFFNLNRTMDATQITQTADLIVECYSYMMPEDFVRCFKNIKMLKYGKLYEGIDGSKIIEFIEIYSLERDEEITNLRKEESKKFKEESRQVSGVIYEVLVSINEKFKNNQIEKQKEITRTEQHKLIAGYFREFDKLCKAQQNDLEGIRVVKYASKVLSQEQYIKYRLKEA